MDRGKMSSAGRGAKSKAPQHPQDIFALGSKSTVVVSRDSEKRNIHKPSTSSVERKRETSGFGSAPPSKRARIGSPAESVGGTSLEVDPVDLVPNVLQALDTHNSDKLLGLLTGSIRLLKSQRAKPDPILCMSMLYLCKIRPNMFAHDTVTQTLCTLLKREQGAAFKNKGNPLVFVLACNMLYAGHRESNNWPDTFIKVYIEDALNERWWVECSWCKCLVENIVTAFSTKQPPQHLIPTESTLGTMSPSGSGSPLMISTEDDTADTDLEYSVFPRYSSSYETVEALVLEAIKDQIQRRAAPDAIGKGFLKLLSATCGFPEIRMISASRLEAWLHSGKLWRCGQELLAYVCCNADACGPTAARDHEVLAQLARMRLKTKPLQQAYQACLREMVSESPALLRSVVTHTIYNELSTQRSPHNMAVLAALVQAQPQLVPTAMAETYLELVMRAEDYLRPLRALTRECVRGARADVAALLPLARALAQPPASDVPNDIRERAFCTIADLFCVCCLVTASHVKHAREHRVQLAGIQAAALAWMLDPAPRLYRPSRHLYQHQLNKIMFLEPAETYSKPDNWPPESERAYTYRLCCEAPLPHSTLLRIIYIGLSKETPVGPAEVLELLEAVVRRACGTDGEQGELSEHDLADLVFQLTQFNPPDNITLPAGYSPPPLAITSLYWRAWLLLVMLCAHNSATFSTTYPTLTTLIDTCITGKPSVEWNAVETERVEAERAAILQLETHLAASSGNKLPISEHNSRLLSQLTTLDPAGPARKPPAAVLEQLQQLNQQLKLGKLLCRQPALLLELVERHGTRRAMPWLHQLLTHDQLQLSVLPVQCLCEFLSAGAGPGGAADAARAAALAAHVRRVLHDTSQGAACVLAYYAARLAHHSPATRLTARTGLKLVLSTSDDAELDYNADVSPDEWMDLLWELRHWESVRSTFVSHVRAACQLECVPRHVASYITLLDKYLTRTPTAPLADIALDLSQVLMERMTVMSSILPPAEMKPHLEPNPLQHRTLYSLTKIFYTYMQKVISEGVKEDEVVEGGADRVVVQWSSGKRALMHLVIAHANLKLMCCGPSIYDTDQEMYSYLVSLWVGSDQALVLTLDGSEEAELLPDWLRLHLVRSARSPLLEAGLRGLPAHKLALFIQTFGMPVASMSGLLRALDACPAGSIGRVGVERGYMWQLLGVQRARGATGGAAFAAALRLQPDQALPDENLFTEEPLPSEPEDMEVTDSGLMLEAVPKLLDSIFTPNRPDNADLDMAFIMLISKLTEEVTSVIASSSSPCRFVDVTISFLHSATTDPTRAGGLLQHQVYSATLLRTLVPANIARLKEISSTLLQQYKCVSGPVLAALSALHDTKQEPQPQHLVPNNATKEQLITILESSVAGSLECIGNRIIETQEPQLVVDAIATILENSQDGKYENKIKSEDGVELGCHVFSARALGCGVLLDWISELQREMVEPRQRLVSHTYVIVECLLC